MNLNPFHETKILTYYNEIKQILKGDIPLPRSVAFFPSQICNHSCAGCHSYRKTTKYPFLKTSKFEEIIDELAELSIKGVELSGGGEPLMHPDIENMIGYIISKKIKIGIITNGTLMTENIKKMIVKNFTYIRIALDAASSEIYRKVHHSDGYKILLKNIKNLVDYKKNEESNLTIGLKFLVSKVNYSEVIQATKKAKKLGVDYIQFKALRNSKFEIPKERMFKVKKLLGKAKEMRTKKIQVLGSIEKTHINCKCFLTPLVPVIDYNGDLYLCAFFHHRKRSHKIGNLYENSFRELWGSEIHKKAIENINPSECNIFDCPIHKATNLALDAIKKNKMHLDFI